MASFLGPQRFEIIVDRDKFERELAEVMNKLLNSNEAPAKEKHVRSTLIATWREKGCLSFWNVLKHYPLLRNHIVCWKACFILHRTFRDGHPQVLKKSAAHIRYLGDLGKHWGHAVAGYAPLITAYVKVLMNRITFHVKNPEIPASLNFEDSPFKVPSDIDHVFQMAVEVFDMQSTLLHFYAAVLNNLDPSKGVNAQMIQCRLSPMVPAILDSAAFYDLIFKVMKALHAALPADTLAGHRDRFNRQYTALRKYFHEASRMKYLQSLVKIPSLTPDPPSFLLPGQLVELELSTQVEMLAQEDDVSQSSLTITQEQNPFGGPQVEDATPTRFDDEFGSSEFEQFDFQKKDDRDALIEQLMREIVELKEKIAELEGQREADHELISGLRERLEQLEAELSDYKEIAEQTCNENVLLKNQIEASQTEQGAQAESEARVKAMDEKFTKLREVYQKLRQEHIVLLRSSGETQKKLKMAETEVEEASTKTRQSEEQILQLTQQVEGFKIQADDEAAQVAVLREELRQKEMQSEEQILQLTQQVEGFKIQADDEAAQVAVLREELRQKETRFIQQEQAQQSLAEQLQAKEAESTSAPHKLIVEAVEEAESVLRHVLEGLSNPALAGLTCTPTFLQEKTQSSLDIIDATTANFSLYNNDPSAVGKALSSLPSFSHAIGEVMVQGVATSHMAPAEEGQKFVESSHGIGNEALQFLGVLKLEKPGSGTIASGANSLQKAIQALNRAAGALAATESEQTEDTLGDILDEELAATAQVVEAAASRIQEMLQKSRKDDSGIKLEVNERILDTCTGLMKAIRTLIKRSKELQLEIVSEGMGTHSTVNEFYKKNSRWSEGLISAAKQVGWGASVLVDAADKVVQGSGKFEELVVASHDIAASTAQLVAASRVKARARSEKLKSLKASSREVSEATGHVVASAQSARELRRSASETKLDFSKLSLTQAKRLEMESQVRALELEKELETERTRLAELRKVHYHLAGASEGWDEEQTAS